MGHYYNQFDHGFLQRGLRGGTSGPASPGWPSLPPPCPTTGKICFMALWGFWNDRARDLGRLLSGMPDFAAARFDAGQLQQAIAAYTPSGGAFSSAHETLRLYFTKMDPRMFATVFETFLQNTLTSQKGSFARRGL